MNYIEALAYFNDLPVFNPKSVVNGTMHYDLVAVSDLLHRLGDPQNKLKFVHITGTNGKGSTAACLTQILTESGLTAGLFTSPSIERLTEQIRIGNTEISETSLAALTTRAAGTISEMQKEGCRLPSAFEILTAIAFLYFLEQKCDLVVLEVGMGGRVDATNVIPSPVLAIITSISLDHTEILGDTLEKIALEKAGIIKKGCSVLLYPQDSSIMSVISDVCAQKEVPCTLAVLPSAAISATLQGQTFEIPAGGHMRRYTTPLLGTYQISNAAMAVQAAFLLREKGYALDEAAIERGISTVTWPGRFEVLQKNPVFIADGSHNLQGVETLVHSLSSLFPGKKFVFIAGVLADKTYDRMLSLVLPYAKCFYTVTPPSLRALEAADLALFLQQKGAQARFFNSIEEAVLTALSDCSGDEIICSFGSLYYVGIVRNIIQKRIS